MFKQPLLFICALLTSACASLALVMVQTKGTWPERWPKELEPSRERAVAYDVAAGIQENVYEIPFDDRAEFERLWPVFLQLKDTGGKLTLISVAPDDQARSLFHTARPAVRVLTPSGSSVKFRGADEQIVMAPPWPDEVFDEEGRLPEYVAWDGERLVGVTSPKGVRASLHRARVDLTLVVDGRVIDLNRIPLPPDTIIVDRRELPLSEGERPARLPATQPADDEPPASAPAPDEPAARRPRPSPPDFLHPFAPPVYARGRDPRAIAGDEAYRRPVVTLGATAATEWD